MKSNHKNFVHLVGLYTYCKMMHGTYNFKLYKSILYYKHSIPSTWSSARCFTPDGYIEVPHLCNYVTN